MNRIAFVTSSMILIFFVSWSCSVMPLHVRLHQESDFYEGKKSIFYIDVFLDLNESVCKDFIKISVDNPDVTILDWEIVGEPIAEYVPPLKLHKKVYKNSCSLKIVVDQKNLIATNFYFSCFVVRGDDQITSIMKKLPVKVWAEKKMTTTFVAHDSKQKIMYPMTYMNVKKQHRSFWFLNTNFLLIIMLGLLFIGFVLFAILMLRDLLLLAFFGFWLFLASIIPHFITFFIAAVWMFFASICFFQLGKSSSYLSLQRARFMLGLLSASIVLPLLVRMVIAFMSW